MLIGVPEIKLKRQRAEGYNRDSIRSREAREDLEHSRCCRLDGLSMPGPTSLRRMPRLAPRPIASSSLGIGLIVHGLSVVAWGKAATGVSTCGCVGQRRPL